MESGLSPTARRHWSLFGPPKSKVHTDFGRFSSESPADEIDSPLPVFDSARRAVRLLLLYAILCPPLTGFRALGRVGTRAAPWRRGRRGFAFQAVTADEIKSPRKFASSVARMRPVGHSGMPSIFDVLRPALRVPIGPRAIVSPLSTAGITLQG